MPEIDFKLRPSRRHFVFLAAVALVSMLSVFATSLPILIQLLLTLAVFSYSVRLYYQTVQQGSPRAILSLQHERGKTWVLTTPQGVVRAKMRSTVVVTRWVSILSFEAPGAGAYTCMIFEDSLPPGQYRQFLAKF